MDIRITIQGLSKLETKLGRLPNLPEHIGDKISKDMAWYFRSSPHVPVDTGHYRLMHRAIRLGPLDYAITNPTRVGDYYLADLIIHGHRTLVTPKQRRFWFWLLYHKYGGNYKRKTKGSPGHVPGRPYAEKIIAEYITSGRPTVKAGEAIAELIGGR